MTVLPLTSVLSFITFLTLASGSHNKFGRELSSNSTPAALRFVVDGKRPEVILPEECVEEIESFSQEEPKKNGKRQPSADLGFNLVKKQKLGDNLGSRDMKRMVKIDLYPKDWKKKKKREEVSKKKPQKRNTQMKASNRHGEKDCVPLAFGKGQIKAPQLEITNISLQNQKETSRQVKGELEAEVKKKSEDTLDDVIEIIDSSNHSNDNDDDDGKDNDDHLWYPLTQVSSIQRSFSPSTPQSSNSSPVRVEITLGEDDDDEKSSITSSESMSEDSDDYRSYRDCLRPPFTQLPRREARAERKQKRALKKMAKLHGQKTITKSTARVHERNEAKAKRVAKASRREVKAKPVVILHEQKTMAKEMARLRESGAANKGMA